MRIYFLVISVLMLLSSGIKPVYGQPHYFRKFQVENGLSYHTVYSSLQDSKGFLWFGTRDGLNRYDGYTFKTFRRNPSDENSLGNNLVVDLYEDRHGLLWIGTSKGLYFYEENKERFRYVEGTANNRISSIQVDNNDNLWFISDSTLCRYDLHKQKLKRYTKQQILEPTSIVIQANQDLWVATNRGLLSKYNSQTDSFIFFNLFQNYNSPFNRIEVIYDTGKGSILVGTSHFGIKIFSTKTFKSEDILNRNPDNTRIFVRDFVRSKPDEFWCATESGVFIYNQLTKKITNIRKQDNDPYSISDNSIYTLTKDREGGIWLGTYFGGVNYYLPEFSFFEKYYPSMKNGSMHGNTIRDICEDKNGMIWVGTEDAGLNRFNPLTKEFQHFIPNGSETSISYTNIHGLLAIGEELWVGTFEHGLDVLNINTGKVLRHYNAGSGENDLKSNFITTLYKTSNDDILVGTSNALYRYDRSIHAFEQIKHVSPKSFVYSLYEDHRGTVWVATIGNGVFYYNPNTKESGNILHDPTKNNSLSSNIVYGIFEDSKHNLWFNTESSGVCILKEDRKKFIKYTIEDGLPSDHTFKVLEDAKNNIWITTYAGLAFLDVKTKKFTVYTKNNGLLANEFNYGSGLKDKQGNLYFGSVKGLIRFNPEKFKIEAYTPPVYITGFQVYNKELAVGQEDGELKKSIINTDQVVLKYNQSSFSIDFAALSFATPQNTSYSYLLEGLEKNWTHLIANRKVYFTELSPGDYTFKIRSRVNGVSEEGHTALRITILPPWWKSTFAYMVYILGVSLIGYYGIRLYLRKLKLSHDRKLEYLENKKEKDIYEAKIEFFTNIAHEIRTPLTLIKGPLEIINKSDNIEEIKDNVETMDKNTTRLLNLTNQLLDFRRIETKVYSLSFVQTNISNMLTENLSRFKVAADNKNIDVVLNLPAIPIIAYVDPEAFTKIISNLLNNAIKYAERKIIISLVHKEGSDFFSIEIKNDGDLISEEFREKIFEPFFRLENTESVLGTGIGLPLARSLATLHTGSLTLEPASMNAFVLRLPVSQKMNFDFCCSEEGSTEGDILEDELSSSNNKTRLLIVDDNKEIVQFIIKALGREYNYTTAINGADALEKLKKHQVNLIVSDIMMPIMDGYSLCKILKTDFDHSHIPIVLLTAKNTFRSKITGLECGADAYIEKPFSPEHLQVQIANLLSNRTKIKDYFASSPLATIKSMANSKADEMFLEKLDDTVQRYIGDTSFAIEQLAEAMNMSRPTLFRKIKAISNLTPNELINIARIKKAAELLTEEQYKIYEVSDMVGFSSPTVFSRIFQRQFGLSPTEFMNSTKKM